MNEAVNLGKQSQQRGCVEFIGWLRREQARESSTRIRVGGDEDVAVLPPLNHARKVSGQIHSRKNPNVTASRLLKSAQMHPSCNRNVQWFKPVLSGLMAGMIVLLSVVASSGALHLKLHQDSSAPQHGTCAICSISQGHVETSVACSPEVFATLSVSWTLPSLRSTPVTDADFSVASSRGPPVSVSSL